MKVTLLMIGRTEEEYLRNGFMEYESRIRHYLSLTTIIVPGLKQKNISVQQQKQEEAELLLKRLNPEDVVILLDEKGKHYTSQAFAGFIQDKMNAGIKNMVFVIGGPFGFDSKMYQRANGTVSLSLMTFSHQMVRLIFAEQLYRAMTILRKEPYHH